MSFSATPWFILPLVAAGGWLAYALYFRTAESLPRTWKWILIGVSVLAWVALAGLLVQPSWVSSDSIYHPPTVVLAVDESPSYAAGAVLNSMTSVQQSLQRVRKFYEDKGFRILELEFGENVRNAGDDQNIGRLTHPTALGHFLDSLAIPNLQAIFTWTDGRFNDEVNNTGVVFPAPVFPVVVQSNAPEIQGEKVEADFSDPDSGTEISVEWRSLDGRGKASMEIQSGARVLWKGPLPVSASGVGEKAHHRFLLPASVFRGAGEHWVALIRPEKKSDNLSEKNDTITVLARGLHHKRQIFLGPLRSLDERGLVDALVASDSMEAITVSAGELESELRKSGVLWARSSSSESKVLEVAKRNGVPVIFYTLSEDARNSSSFVAGAHVAFREDAAKVLPGGVLNLSDLGGGEWSLRALMPQLEPIAWAEQQGRKGVLFAQRTFAVQPVFEVAVPELWSSRFQRESDERIRRLQERWFQGISEWVRTRSRREATAGHQLHRDPMDIELSRIGVDREALAEWALETRGTVVDAPHENVAWPNLSSGQTREVVEKSRLLFPVMISTLSVIALLCLAWVLRKKFRLD